MSRTPITIPSAINGNAIAIIFPANRSELVITIATPDGAKVAQATVDIETLAERLNYIPGITAKYTKPIEIPQYLGAVVERDATNLGLERYVRFAYDSDVSNPWVNRSGVRIANDTIAGVLANGGYEREPEFPVRMPFPEPKR